jgi:hypothetical protein
VIAVGRATWIPIALGVVLLALTYGLGLGLDWSNGAIGMGAVITCVTVAVTRTTLAHNHALRDRAEPDHRA